VKTPWALVLVVGLLGCNEPFKHLDESVVIPRGSREAIAAGPRATDHFATSPGDLAIVPLEHATLLFVWLGLTIYIDPASPSIDDASLPGANFVFITDAHYDHLDGVALDKARMPGSHVFGPPGVAARAPDVRSLEEGQTRVIFPGFEVTAVPAYGVARGPGPGLLYHQRGAALGYVLTFGGTRVYVSGDTECTPEVKALRNIDVAFVSMNVPYAMTPAEATECVAAFRPKVVFPYAFRHARPQSLDRAALGEGIEVRQRDFYPRGELYRARAYAAFTHGQWGYADDLLDEGKRVDPEGDTDWRVQQTRKWLKECEKPWPW
jgi:L-ascorbate metabolism protein UlaG (beta-lactamase superfamily)